MTLDEFRANFGGEYLTVSRSEMFVALLATIDEISPMRRSRLMPLDQSAEKAATLFWQTQGWESLRDFLKTTITETPAKPPREPDFAEPPL